MQAQNHSNFRTPERAHSKQPAEQISRTSSQYFRGKTLQTVAPRRLPCGRDAVADTRAVSLLLKSSELEKAPGSRNAAGRLLVLVLLVPHLALLLEAAEATELNEQDTAAMNAVVS